MDASRAFRRALLRQLLFAGGVSLAALTAGACTSGEECFEHPVDQACPSPQDAQGPISIGLSCEERLESVDGEGERDGAECCYPVTVTHKDGCVIEGRPLMLADGALFSPAVRRGDWSAEQPLPDLSVLSDDERAELARVWRERALAEHASVASFSRFALELMAVGAPPALVADAHRAALDEVRHAAAAFALASAYAGVSLGPGALPLGESLPLRTDLCALAVTTAVEACVNETLAVIAAAEELARCSDEAVREVMLAVVQDEARHAELAWRTVAWAVAEGGEEVRRAVVNAVLDARPLADGTDAALPQDTAQLRAHGVLDEVAQRQARMRGYDEVVLPSLRALVGAGATASAASAACVC